MRTRLALAAVLALALFPAAAHAGGRAPSPGDLFVVNAKGGKIERVSGKPRGFRVVLRRPARDVTLFTDRPERRAGERALRPFVRGWAGLGFADEPPNAALVIHDAPSGRDVLVLELGRPRLGAGGRTLAFPARVIVGNPGGALREFARKADLKVPDRFGASSLFIDSGGQEVGLGLAIMGVPGGGDPVTITFNDAQITAGPGSSVTTHVGTTGPALADLSLTTFVVGATSSASVNVDATMNLDVLATAKSITGSAILPAGVTVTANVLTTQKSFPITSGNFRIPLT